MKNTKTIDIIVALLIAIGLWGYVFSSSGFTSSTIIRNVPISFLNEDSLEAKGLTVIAKEIETVNITYSGHRTATSTVSQEDFKVTCDLEGLSEGETKVRINVEAPESVDVENVNVQNIRILVDQLVTLEKDIKVVVINDNSDDTEPYVVQLSKEKISVTGAKSLVSTVSFVQAELDTTKVSYQLQAISAPLTPINSIGKAVSDVTLSSKNVSVTAVLLSKKTVPLDVPVEGIESTSFTRNVEVPKVITIKGTMDILNEIDSITCETLDISEVFETSSVEIKPIIPETVEIASDSEDMVAKVTVLRATTNTINMSSSDISFNGVANSLKVVVPEMDIEVVVGGTAMMVNSVTKSMITLTCDISKLSAGEHTIKITPHTDVAVSMIKAEPSEITITIE